MIDALSKGIKDMLERSAYKGYCVYYYTPKHKEERFMLFDEKFNYNVVNVLKKQYKRLKGDYKIYQCYVLPILQLSPIKYGEPLDYETR